MKSIFIFLFLIFVIPTAVAVGFSPSSLTFNLQPNEEACGTITLDSESESISVSDKWAKSEETKWKVSLFDTTAEDHNIAITYPYLLSPEERQVEVCLSAENEGEYHGAIIFKQAQEGSSIIQMAVWLKLIIEEAIEPPPVQDLPNNNNQGSGGGGGSSNSAPILPPVETTDDKPEIQELSNQEIPQSPKLENQENQEKTIKSNTTQNTTIIIITLIILITAITIYRRKKA
ncbi:hypothetical protein CMI47_17615 [Candidatus Pacearchaeota archaeon]|nr:hypothetical protein [Candidatus Pacearchaeota archaeon]|tara:strand:+ start:3556 stop:4248 length:693 start_codon:yes stop_codon:yes gene_type:complete